MAEKKEEDEDSRERQARNDIAQEVVASINDKAGVYKDGKLTAHRTIRAERQKELGLLANRR